MPIITFTCRDMRDYSSERFDLEFSKINWDHFYLLQDPNHLWDYLYDMYLSVIITTAPIIEIKWGYLFSESIFPSVQLVYCSLKKEGHNMLLF